MKPAEYDKTMRTLNKAEHGYYRCRCGKELLVDEAWEKVRADGLVRMQVCELCTVDPSGRHVYKYIHPNGLPSLRGSVHS